MDQLFRRVSYQTRTPSPSWTAWKHKEFGRLIVGTDAAQFYPKRGDAVAIDRVARVSKGWRNQVHGERLLPAVNTYIEVIYGDPTEPQVAYVNDARWLHLASYLPHRRLLAALAGLVGSGG